MCALWAPAWAFELLLVLLVGALSVRLLRLRLGVLVLALVLALVPPHTASSPWPCSDSDSSLL